MQSSDYVPGVSGWKIDDEFVLVLNDGNRRIKAKTLMVTTAGPGLTNDQAAESIRESIAHEVQARCQADEALATHIGAMECRLPEPFIVVDGVTYISEAEVERGSITNAKIGDSWLIKMELRGGQYFATGIGVGIDSQCLVSADKFAINEPGTDKSLEEFVACISRTELASALAEQVEQIRPVAETVREIIREELRPGGILHRK